MGFYQYVLIAGSTKCASTSLFHYLADHPEICASKLKETRFFLDDDYPAKKIIELSKDFSDYEKLFKACSNKKIRLEASPHYLYSNGTPSRIKKLIPDCKFIFILRNPIDRLISWYKYAMQRGYISEAMTINEFIREQSYSKGNMYPAEEHMLAMEEGRYFYYLKRYFDLYDAGNIFVILYDELIAHPKEVLTSLCSFINVDPGYYKTYDFKIFNKSVSVKNYAVDQTYRSLKKKIRFFNNSLPEKIKIIIRKAGRAVDQKYKRVNTLPWKKSAEISPELLNQLKNLYDEDKKKLESVLQSKIPW